jgi:hypothetical protein
MEPNPFRARQVARWSSGQLAPARVPDDAPALLAAALQPVQSDELRWLSLSSFMWLSDQHMAQVTHAAANSPCPQVIKLEATEHTFIHPDPRESSSQCSH